MAEMLAPDLDQPEPLKLTDTANTNRERPWWRFWSPRKPQAIDDFVTGKLAEQFRRSLLTDFRALPRPDDDAPEQAYLYDQAVTLLSKQGASWPEIEEAQKIQAHLIPEDVLDAALEREIEEGLRWKLDTRRIADRVRLAEPHGPSKAEKRAHLVRLVSDLQWARQENTVCRRLRGLYVKHVCLLTLFVGILFLIALIWTVNAHSHEGEFAKTVNEHLQYPGLVIAVTSGILGAWFSMLVSINKRLSGLTLEELRVAQRYISLIGRLIFGGASAVIFYFLLQSGLFSAGILPEIRAIGFEQMNLPDGEEVTLRELAMRHEIKSNTLRWMPTKDLCLLIIWCVLCGFSEKLIPAALTQTSDNGTNSAEGERAV